MFFFSVVSFSDTLFQAFNYRKILLENFDKKKSTNF